MAKKILEVKHLKKYFPLQTNFFGKPQSFLRAVDDVSFYIEEGKTLGIVGESGCGKTTLGRAILRLHEPTAGEVLFTPAGSDEQIDITKLSKTELRKFRPQMQIIFQDPYSSLSPRQPVGEIIGEAVRVHKIVTPEEYKDYIYDVMVKCGLQTHYFERYPHEFSGGQRQRICIARALALKPRLVICDEPVSALDVSIQAQVINLLKDLQNDFGFTYMFISHDLSVVEHISDNVGVMYLGSMVETGPKESIYANPMHPYTKALFSAVPVPDPNVKMNRIILKGDIPSPANPPKGCKFHTRCIDCMDICKEITPFFNEYEPGHFCACHKYAQNREILDVYMQLKQYLEGYNATQEKVDSFATMPDKLLKKQDGLNIGMFIVEDAIQLFVSGNAQKAQELATKYPEFKVGFTSAKAFAKTPVTFTLTSMQQVEQVKALLDELMASVGMTREGTIKPNVVFTSSNNSDFRSGCMVYYKLDAVDAEIKKREQQALEAKQAKQNNK
ncbi:MAG: ATP-binding cassette domain-containing protein [Clostridia bacterium]|nr:ATP-binding cassette domain-containing protein [Clostridia bacterium]